MCYLLMCDCMDAARFFQSIHHLQFSRISVFSGIFPSLIEKETGASASARTAVANRSGN